jgi:hypothetical protein
MSHPAKQNGRPAANAVLGVSISWKWTCGSLELPELPHSAVAGPLGPPARRDRYRAAFEVGKSDVGAIAQVEYDMVAEQAGCAE